MGMMTFSLMRMREEKAKKDKAKQADSVGQESAEQKETEIKSEAKTEAKPEVKVEEKKDEPKATVKDAKAKKNLRDE